MGTIWNNILDGAATSVGATKGDKGDTGPQGPTGPMGPPAPTTVITEYPFTGTGAQTVFSFAGVTAPSAGAVLVSIDGVVQSVGSFTHNNSGGNLVLTFSEAPPLGAAGSVRVLGYAAPVGVADASAVAYLAPATGAVSRTAAAKLGDVVSAADFGAVGNGTTDDTAAIQAGIDALFAAGGGVLRFGVGTFVTTGLVLKDGVTLEGVGKGVTILKLANGANQHVIQAGDFDTWADGVNRSTPVGCRTAGLRDLTVDGNKANQTQAKSCFAYYGVDVQMDGVECRQAKGVTVQIESPGATFSVVVGRNLQSNLRHCEFHDGDAGNLYYNGQSDSNIMDVLCYQAGMGAGQYNARFGPKAQGSRVWGLHCWGDTDYALINEGSRVAFMECHLESAAIAKLWVKAATYIPSAIIYQAGSIPDASVGILIDANGGSSIINAYLSNVATFVAFPATGGTNLRLRLDGFSAGATLYTGTIPASGNIEMINNANGDSLRQIRGNSEFRGTVTAGSSSVNRLVLAGAVTAGRPKLTFTGDDATVNAGYYAKGGGGHAFFSDEAGTTRQFNVEHVASAIHYLSALGGTTGVAGPQLIVRSSETDVDLRLVPKGTGRVRFGTHTANADAAITGYVEIKDANGTVRKLAVIA